MSSATNHIAVYARWRPPSQTERADATLLTDNTIQTTSVGPELSAQVQPQHLKSISITRPSEEDKFTATTSWTSSPAFSTVFKENDDNKTIYDTVVAPSVPKVLRGQNFSVFAYGHSGSGKTHTIIGPNEVNQVDSGPGLCIAAARHLFHELDLINTSHKAESAGASKHLLGIGLSVFELRKSSAYDLLCPDQKECFIRQGSDGRTHIRGATETLEGGKVRVRPLRQTACFDVLTLETTLKDALKGRQVGNSSIHEASSRTHCVIELEIVNRDLVSAREELWDRQSELVPVGKRATDVMIEEQSKGVVKDKDGKWAPNPAYVIDQERIDHAEKEKNKFEGFVRDAEKRIEDVLSAGRGSGGDKGLGAKLVFVDLAGAEYHTEKGAKGTDGMMIKGQTPKEKQEGRQINSDLLALKEVIRAWSNGQPRIPFRSSPLTMVLREHFLGQGDTESERVGGQTQDKRGCTAMIVTASPANSQYSATMNSLKYGALVGAASRRT